MKLFMNINDLNTIEQMEQFLTGSKAVAFLVASSNIPFAEAVGFVADLNSDAVFSKLLGLDVIRATGVGITPPRG
jgi:hypothetical protein